MKLNYTLLTAVTSLLLLASCSQDSDRMSIPTENDPQKSQTVTYPQDDGSTLLTGSNASMIRRLLEHLPNLDFARTLGTIEISDEEYNEIATFTTNLVAGSASDKDKYDKIFNWITSNIKYTMGAWVDNRPYAVFTTKEAICQGYADLLTVMMHTQQIPCFTINGEVYIQGFLAGAHAWNYIYLDKWSVSDPTNGKNYALSAMSSYSHLHPTHISSTIFEDEYCKYNFFESNLNVCSIKPGREQVTIPYSVSGLRITSVSPTTKVPSEVREIYIGKNITTLGNYSIGLSYLAPNVETYYIDPENEVLESFSNVIYKKNSGKYEMYLVSPNASTIELLPIEYFDKESKLKNLSNLETIIFAPGTKRIGAWTVEFCPRLHTAYIPEETIVEDEAFYDVAGDFKIVRGNYTNIPQIKY